MCLPNFIRPADRAYDPDKPHNQLSSRKFKNKVDRRIRNAERIKELDKSTAAMILPMAEAMYGPMPILQAKAMPPPPRRKAAIAGSKKRRRLNTRTLEEEDDEDYEPPAIDEDYDAPCSTEVFTELTGLELAGDPPSSFRVENDDTDDAGQGREKNPDQGPSRPRRPATPQVGSPAPDLDDLLKCSPGTWRFVCGGTPTRESPNLGRCATTTPHAMVLESPPYEVNLQLKYALGLTGTPTPPRGYGDPLNFDSPLQLTGTTPVRSDELRSSPMPECAEATPMCADDDYDQPFSTRKRTTETRKAIEALHNMFSDITNH